MMATNMVMDILEKERIRNPVLWPRGVDLDLFKSFQQLEPKPPASGGRKLAKKSKNKKPIYITVGRVSHEKNLEVFLDLDLDGEKWIVGGDPHFDHLKEKYPDVKFLRIKRTEELSALYRQADVFVFPSRTDTFGLVLLDAMGFGLPVAAYPVAGPLDVIGDSDGGLGCVNALEFPRHKARAHAEKFSWENATSIFVSHLVEMRPMPLKQRM